MAGQLSLVFQLCTRIFKIHFDEMSFKCSRQKIPFPDQQRRHRSVAQHRQGAGGVSGVPVAHPQLQHPLHPSAAAVMAGPSVHPQPLFSPTSSQSKSLEASSSKTSSSSNTSTSISTSGSNLPPEVISQLLATGHLVREDGNINLIYTIVRWVMKWGVRN